MSDFLVFDRVTKTFGAQRAVDSVSLTLERGEIFSLLGPSGCGKTTLLRIAAGFEQPDSGRVLLGGRDITRLPAHKRPLNTVFQSYALFPHLTVFDNIAFGLRIAGAPAERITREVARMLELTQLGEHTRKKPAQLSGGQRQRTAIARALINHPQVLLLDEPLAALDHKLRHRLLLELRRLHAQVQTTFLYVTHDQDEAMALSTRMAVMRNGRIEQVGTPAELYEHPASRFTAGFIGEGAFLSGRLAKAADGMGEIEVPALGRLRCRLQGGIAPGEAAGLHIRPECVELSRNRPDGGLESVPGTITAVTYLGSHFHCWIDAAGHLLLARVPKRRSDDAPAAGAQVWVSWAAADGLAVAAEEAANDTAGAE